MNSREVIVLNHINKHKEQWITGGALINEIKQATFNQMSLTPVELRATIQCLRLQGNTIIAGTKGYKLTTSIKEIKEYCEYRRVEIQLELKVIYAMETKAQEYGDNYGK